MKHRIVLRVVPQSDSPRAAVLRDLLAQAETNYVLLMRLMPDMRRSDRHAFGVTGPSGLHADVVLTVRERGPFTTLIDLVETHATDGWVAPLQATVRLSHDARVAEVTEFRRRRRLQARYPYPNPDMLHPDEKLQINRLLGEWLQHCLRWGEARPSCPV
ncbi:MAG: DUF1249 domain-containing protein [Pseudomonadota bacterium]